MDFEHEIIGFKDRGDKNYVDENVSEHGNINFMYASWVALNLRETATN